MDTKGLEKNLPREVKHFTAENTAENTYGWTWDKVVKLNNPDAPSYRYVPTTRITPATDRWCDFAVG